MQRKALHLLAVVTILAGGARSADAQIEFGTLFNLGDRINTHDAEFGSSISCDGLSLFFNSCQLRPLDCNIRVASRDSTVDAFGIPVSLGPEINSPAFEVYPTISSDGLELYFADRLLPGFPGGPMRPGGLGGGDLWVSRRASTSDPFGVPENLGPTINSRHLDGYPKLTRDGLELYFASLRPGGAGGADIWVSRRPSTSEAFGTPENLGPFVNSRFGEGSQDVSADGLVIIVASNRPGGQGGWDLWMSTRESTDDEFGPAVNLGSPINTSRLESGPNLSADVSALFFESIRPGGRGVGDLYQVEVSYQRSVEGVCEKPQPRFQRGDANADGSVDVSDPVVNLGFQFLGSFDPPCHDALDFNDDGVIDITDPVANLTNQFIGGPPPAAPGKDACGVDPTEDDLGCESFAACPAGG